MGRESAADEYATHPDISLAFFFHSYSIGLIVANMVQQYILQLVKYKRKQHYLKLCTGLKAEVALADETK
jgi:hypothetical protein